MIRVPADQPTIQAGIDAAVSGDVVLVSPGVYMGSGNKDLDLRNRDLEIRSEGGPEATIIDCDDSGRAFYLVGLLTEAATVAGFTIRNGNVEGDSRGGGAIFVAGGAPTIRDCIFEDNRAEGIYQEGGGGAISLYNASPAIIDCRFTRNSVIGPFATGGALAAHDSFLRVTECLFERNVAAPASGAGGGIGIVDSAVDTLEYVAIIENCEFLNNESNDGGGGFFVRSRLDHCTFSGNHAQGGGGFYAILSEISDSSVNGNIAIDFGGGAYLGSSTLSRCVIKDNSAQEGGGLRALGHPATVLNECILARNVAMRGGAFSGIRGGTQFIGCSIVANQAPVASGAYLMGLDSEIWSFERTIISGGQYGEAVRCEGNATAVLSCSNVFGNAGGDWVGCLMGQQATNGNLSSDPLFCLVEIDWHLCSDSPCAPDQTGECGLIGALPVGCGHCVKALEPSTWGQIKYQARWRASASDAEK